MAIVPSGVGVERGARTCMARINDREGREFDARFDGV